MSSATATDHRIRWFVYADGVKIPRTAAMRGQWGYDAVCSCGWETLTGGAVRQYVEDEIWMHKFQASTLSREGS